MMTASTNDEETRRAFEPACSGFGWVEGRNIHIVYRGAELSQMRAVVAELVASAPDVIVAFGTSVLNAVREATNSIPVVFVGAGAGVQRISTDNLTLNTVKVGVNYQFGGLGR